ncbi:MAG TPA: hypothetical protein VFE33_06460, partial [Thermoanaerobaculia bacterium]|nr:hypothetical protein [Thermoanaerobaculia bacterium]
MRRSGFWLALFLLLTPLTTAAGLPAAPPPAAGLPKEAHPLSPALEKHMDTLVHAAEEYRGL